MKQMLRICVVLLVVCAASALQAAERYDWSKAKKVHPSVLRASFAVDEPRLMKVFAVRIDLTDRRLRFHATGRADHWGEPMPDYAKPGFVIRTERQTCRDFMLNARKDVSAGGLGLDMRAAVNCNPWEPWEKPWNHKYADKTGLLISNGELVAPSIGYPSLVFYKDGRIEFRNVGAKDDISNIQTAVSGFGLVLTNGVLKAKLDTVGLAPRTAIGIDKRTHYMYLLAIDGRQEGYSLGASAYDVGEWLRYLGAYTGMNMDGGGSTTLICWDETPDPENQDPKSKDTPNLHKLNRQGDNAERSLAASLGFYFVEKGARRWWHLW